MKRGHVLTRRSRCGVARGDANPPGAPVRHGGDGGGLGLAGARPRPPPPRSGHRGAVHEGQGEINVARHLQRHHPWLKFILLSGHRHPAVVKEALEAGASGFLLRQTVASDLIMAVRAVRQNRLFISPIAETHLWAQSNFPSSIH